MMFRRLFLLLVTASLCSADEGDLVFRPPTNNDALFRGDNEGFYMYCDRNFEQVKSQPWEAGTYGMVRNPFRTSDGRVMFSHIHEGIDIKPMVRDAKGEPQDMVRPIAPGRVAYVNPAPGASNYGRYVVVEHQLPEGVFYSLYAHLAAITCEVGQRVGTGNELGRLGYSGSGINKTRAHVHLELCFLINRNYTAPSNKHGMFNGFNLVSINAANVLLHCRDGEPFSMKDYVSRLPEHYRVRVPSRGIMPDLLVRYPFLYKGTPGQVPPAYDMAFTAEGVPVAVYPCAQAVTAPSVISCQAAPTLQQNLTVNRVKGSSANAALTVSGKKYIEQFFAQPSAAPAPNP